MSLKLNINTQRLIPIAVVLAGCLFYSSSQSVISNYKLSKVVIDAGHGGHDPGCSGRYAKEKDVTLSIALKLGAYIEKNMKGVKVIYTRDTDVFIELFRRAQIANENNADLFISIHCNANKSTDPHGTETYVMGLHKSDENMHIASVENAAILLEDDYKNQYQGFDIKKGFDPNSTEFYISYQLYQKAYLEQSLQLADKVQKQFTDNLGLFNRGVKQAGFLVLWRTTMPGVLIEAGFLSNPNDEKVLKTEKGQDKVAQLIFKAFREYKSKIEGVTYTDAKVEPLKVYADIPEEPDTIAITPLVAAPKPDTSKPAVVEKPIEKPIVTPAPKPVSPKPVVVKKDTAISKTVALVSDTVIFKVQLGTVRELAVLKKPPYASVKQLSYYKQDDVYKVTAGRELEYAKAVALQTQVRAQGFKDAFLIAFLNGKRITIPEAIQKIKKQ